MTRIPSLIKFNSLNKIITKSTSGLIHRPNISYTSFVPRRIQRPFPLIVDSAGELGRSGARHMSVQVTSWSFPRSPAKYHSYYKNAEHPLYHWSSMEQVRETQL